jgi:hypothetical protein
MPGSLVEAVFDSGNKSLCQLVMVIYLKIVFGYKLPLIMVCKHSRSSLIMMLVEQG